MPKIDLTGDQLTEAMAEFLRHGNVSALLNRVATAMDTYAHHVTPRHPGEASWDQYAAGRMRLHADRERRLEDDFYTDASNNKIAQVETIEAADAILAPWLDARGV